MPLDPYSTLAPGASRSPEREVTAAAAAPVAYDLPAFLGRYGISRATFYREVAAGRLVATKVGRRSIVQEEHARAWLASLPTTAKAGTPKPAPEAR